MTDTEKRLAQDDEIFNRARLVNCGLFVQIILGDYVGAILGLARDGLTWRLNPMEVSDPYILGVCGVSLAFVF
jgi:linoleate 10R-lipoxygenase